MYNPEDPHMHPTQAYKSLKVVPAIELASGMPHAKGKRASRTTHMIEVKNNTVSTRTVSGKSKN